MVRDLFRDRNFEYHRDRIISVFGVPEVTISDPVEPRPDILRAFVEIDDMVEIAGQALDALERHADLLTVPIGEDDNEVRAAHLRLGGDGRFITFSQFQRSVNAMKVSRADYAFNTDLKGYGFSDQRKVERTRMGRALGQATKDGTEYRQ